MSPYSLFSVILCQKTRAAEDSVERRQNLRGSEEREIERGDGAGGREYCEEKELFMKLSLIPNVIVMYISFESSDRRIIKIA